MATRSRRRKDSTRTSPAGSRNETETRVGDLLLLDELHAHLPIGMLVHDAETLEILHAHAPLSGPPDPDQEQAPHIAVPELASLVEEVAATGSPQHVPELRHQLPAQEPRWWSATLHRLETDRWGRVVVMLAVDVTDRVRARELLEEREARHQALRQAMAAAPGDNLVVSLRRLTDALVRAVPIDVATLGLLDADANLHLVAAGGLRSADIRRLTLEPLAARRRETMDEGKSHSLLGSLGLPSLEVRWLDAGGDRIGALTVGARTPLRLSEDHRALLDSVAAQLGSALVTIERSSRHLRSRSLELARLSADEDDAGQTRANELRPRELAILRLYGEGLGTAQIAELLVLSPHTVRTHVRNARRRLGVKSRGDALDLLERTDTDP